MADLLVVLNPRAISECLDSYEALDIDRCYLTGYPESLLSVAQREIPEYDRYVVISDDCVVSQKALDAVLDYLGAVNSVVTGYCRLDSKSPFVNLSRLPITDPMPRVSNYDFMSYMEVATSETPLIRTGFVGMALTGMTRDIWERFPFDVSPIGAQCDYSLSYRLTQAGIQMAAHRDAFVQHCKEVWNQPDVEHRKRLLIGEVPSEVRMEYATPLTLGQSVAE